MRGGACATPSFFSSASPPQPQAPSPPAGDPAQQKMMMLMPVIMLFFFYSFPSGLALYWTVNNVLSIIQMKISQYSAKKEEENLARTSVAGKKS